MSSERGEESGVAQRGDVVFHESGASWLWLLAGPVAALAMIIVQYRAGLGFRPTVPAMFLVLVSGMLGVQIKAARVHTSVELTPQALREGTEIIEVDQIVEIYPEPEEPTRSRGPMQNWRMRNEPKEKWQRARAFGDLSGVPRGRTPIGVRLANGRVAQAWARDHERLRTELVRLVGAR